MTKYRHNDSILMAAKGARNFDAQATYAISKPPYSVNENWQNVIPSGAAIANLDSELQQVHTRIMSLNSELSALLRLFDGDKST